MKQLKIKDLVSLFIFIIIILSIGISIGTITSTNIPIWFINLNSPAYAPPNWIFAPVWTIIYIMIAISGWLIFQKNALRDKVFIIYLIQLCLNFLWSFIFFYWHQIDLALLEMSVLWIFLAWNIGIFIKINKLAGYLLVPYFIWINFAWILNLGYFSLN